MYVRQTWLAALTGLALSGGLLVSSEARAWHYGVPHGGYYGGEEGRRYRGGRDDFADEEHHRPRHHRHCREVEFHDHHGRHRIRTVCD